MAKIYADLLVAKRRVWSTVPALIQDAVKVVLQGYVVAGIITAEDYLEIVGEPYEN